MWLNLAFSPLPSEFRCTSSGVCTVCMRESVVRHMCQCRGWNDLGWLSLLLQKCCRNFAWGLSYGPIPSYNKMWGLGQVASSAHNLSGMSNSKCAYSHR